MNFRQTNNNAGDVITTSTTTAPERPRKYAVHASAHLQRNGTLYGRGVLGFIFAVSEDEASGKGMRWAERRWPRLSGWVNHIIVVIDASDDDPCRLMNVEAVSEENIENQ